MRETVVSFSLRIKSSQTEYVCSSCLLLLASMKVSERDVSVHDLGLPHESLAGVPQSIGRQTHKGSLREVGSHVGLVDASRCGAVLAPAFNPGLVFSAALTPTWLWWPAMGAPQGVFYLRTVRSRPDSSRETLGGAQPPR